ncbi:hypothetical protein CPC16_005995, partial [Podila verticillata]
GPAAGPSRRINGKTAATMILWVMTATPQVTLSWTGTSKAMGTATPTRANLTKNLRRHRWALLRLVQFGTSHISLSPVSQGPSSDSGSMYNFRREDNISSTSSVCSINPFSAGPSLLKLGVSLRRTSSMGRSSFISRKPATISSLSGTCTPICWCSNEDEETQTVKAMGAARK